MRDEFSVKVKDLLAKRVAYCCSNPECGMATIGPNSDAMKATSIGVAAHISAASTNGPRFDREMSEETRTSVENGIWLCQSCAKLIDSDLGKYTVKLLGQWKSRAEQDAGVRLNKQISAGQFAYAGKGDAQRIEQNGYYERQLEGQKIRFFLEGDLLHVEQELANGAIAYYVINQVGDLVSQKFPYDISEYSLIVEPNLILSTVEERLPNGFTKELINMKWGKSAVVVRDTQKLIADIRVEKGSTVDHIAKTITVKAPEFKSN